MQSTQLVCPVLGLPGRFLIALTALLVLCSPLRSQETRGTILGRVTDPSGALIAGAEVRATNDATGVSTNARSNEAGNYALPYLLPGFYTIQAEMSGFKRFVREGIQVRIRDTVEVNLEMQLGDTSESIEVKAETPLLSTADVSLGQTVDSRQITELPSFGGSPMDLVHLTPGMMNNTDLRVRKLSQVGANSSFTVDGTGVWTNDFTVDGVSDTMKYYTGNAYMAFVPPQSAVSEFRVQSSSFDASVGHTMGALVNVSTKSGTNQLHGEMHEVLQNSALNCRNIFQNRSGQRIPQYQDHRYGVSGGGPVYIPHVYNGKNKTFWFYAYEANPWVTPATWIGAVPTLGMRKGDLSDLLKIGPNYQVYDPRSTAAAPDGRYSRQPIPNNIIPPSLLDPVAQKILNYWPLPNAAGNADGSNNWFTVENGHYDSWLNMGRVDHAFSASHRFYLRASTDFYSQNQTHRFNTPWDGEYGRRRIHSVALDDVYVLNPTLLVNVRYGLTQQNFEDRRTSQGFDLSTLGFSPQTVALVTDKKNATFPNVNIGSILPLSTNGYAVGDGMASSQTHSFMGSATLTRGDHSFQFGGEFRAYREFRNNNPYELSPQLTFSSAYTRGPFNTSPAPPVGGEMTAFLLGIPGGQMTRTASFASQELYYALYIQDNIKLTPKLTLNLGLRYELETPLTERFNRSVSQFASDVASPIEAQAITNYTASYPANPIAELPVSQFRVRGGLLFAGVSGNPRELWKGSKNDFLPRIGLAWQAFPHTVVRAGYAIFYDTIGTANRAPLQYGYSQQTPIQASLDNGLTYIATLANPFPKGLLPPPGAAGGLSTYLGQSISAFTAQGKRPYAQRWSFGIQRVLPGQVLAEATYVGNRGTHIGVSHDLDFLPAQYFSKSLVRDQSTINYLAQSFPNPLSGTNSIYGTTTSRSSILRPYPQFSSLTVSDPVGYTWYHSLQMRAEKRFAHGYNFQMAYTWAKTMDATSFLNASDPVPYRRVPSLDRPQRIAFSALWDLPVGRGRSWGGSMPKPVDLLVGGWRLGMVLQLQSGPPLGWGDIWTLFTGNPDNVKLPGDQRSVDRWFNIDAGFNRNSAQQLASNIRYSSPAFSNLRADRQERTDFSIVKSFPVKERLKFEFRAEGINAWNHPNLFSPNTSPTASTFGTITQQDVPRVWQLSLRLTY
jgi:hypothetical protein